MSTSGPSIGGSGNSASLKGQISRRNEVFDDFLAADKGFKRDGGTGHACTFDELSEEALCSRPLFQRYAGYLVHEYKKSDSDRYATGTILATLSSVMGRAAAKYKGVQRHAMFFTAVHINNNTDPARWFKGVKNNIEKICFNEAKKAGDPTSKKAPPLYLVVLEAIVAAYACEGSDEAIRAKFACLGGWQSAGRTAELAYIALSEMEWDPHYAQVLALHPQFKTHKVKLDVFVTGARRNISFFLHLGDFLMVPRPLVPGDKHWLNPWLIGVKNPGKKIGAYFKNMLPPSQCGSDKYPNVPGVPLRVSGASARKGFINTVLPVVPGEMVIQSTGHSMKDKSAVYEYFDANPALQQPACVVKSGFSAFDYGKNGMGPRCATLDMHDAETQEKLESMMDVLYNCDSSCPPMQVLSLLLFLLVL